MDTTNLTTLSTTRHVLRVMDRVQKGHLVEVWTETIDHQEDDQEALQVEGVQDFLKRVASAESGTIEDGQDYIVLTDQIVQDNDARGAGNIFHVLEANRYTASMALNFRRV